MSANKKSAQTHVFIAFVALITIPTANSGLNPDYAVEIYYELQLLQRRQMLDFLNLS